jgi:uncharacterized protein YecT (DUF1311 family)
MIKFNEVTWYSKLLAAVVIFGVLPMIAFCIGRQYQEVIALRAVPVQDMIAHTNNVTPVTDISGDMQITADTDCGQFIYQQAMNACSAEVLSINEARMNDLYKKVYESGIVVEIEVLQKSWRIYSDNECEAQGSIVERGSLEPLVENSCKNAMVLDRIEVLKQWIHMTQAFI